MAELCKIGGCNGRVGSHGKGEYGIDEDVVGDKLIKASCAPHASAMAMQYATLSEPFSLACSVKFISLTVYYSVPDSKKRYVLDIEVVNIGKPRQEDVVD